MLRIVADENLILVGKIKILSALPFRKYMQLYQADKLTVPQIELLIAPRIWHIP